MKKRLLALMGKKNELKQKAISITDAAIAENRAMTADEQAEFDKIKDEIKQVESNIEALTAMMDDGEGVPAGNPIREGGEPEDKTKFKTFGEQLRAIYNAAVPGGSVDARLHNEASGANGGTASDGGFLVQEDYVNDLINNAYETGVLASKVRKIPMSTAANVLNINGINENSRADGSRWGGIQSYWESEAAEIAGSKPTFKQISLKLKKLTGLCYATDELLEDAPALSNIISTAFGDEFGFKIDDAIINGSGTGEPLGILKSPALVTIAKETDQTSTLVVENLVKMLAACYDKQGKAEWYLNRELLPALVTLKLGDTPVYLPGNNIAGAPYGTLFGKPVNFIEQASGAGELGDIILADMSQYILTDKSGVNAQQSIHVRFVYDETAFRFIYRADGQPAWNSPKTPYKGAQKQSPFVTLAARK